MRLRRLNENPQDTRMFLDDGGDIEVANAYLSEFYAEYNGAGRIRQRLDGRWPIQTSSEDTSRLVEAIVRDVPLPLAEISQALSGPYNKLFQSMLRNAALQGILEFDQRPHFDRPFDR